MPIERDLRILIVDDKKAMRQVLAAILKAEGFRNIEYAEDGRQALEMLYKTEQDFELVLLDWDMPGVDGMKVLESMRETPRFAEIPVIMVTAEALTDSIIKAIQSGATDYIVKPYAPLTVYKKLQAVLGDEL